LLNKMTGAASREFFRSASRSRAGHTERVLGVTGVGATFPAPVPFVLPGIPGALRVRQLLAAAELPEAPVRLGRPAPPPGLAAGQDSGRPEVGDAAGAGQLIDIGGNPL
jgi:hypothetical protein